MYQVLSTRICSGLFVVALLVGIYGCAPEEREIATLTVDEEEAKQYAHQVREELSLTLAEGLDISLWASEKLVSDPVALHIDDFGRALVTITERRRNAEIDIRNHRDWMRESVGFETVEDRRDFLHRILRPERSEDNRWLDDYNEDGSRDWRDLTVHRESVFRLEDVSENGHADQAKMLIRDFHDEITDVAGAVLFHEGNVFLGVAPDMWRIQDTNGDGYGDQKRSISHGYGVNVGFGGHGMSGLTVGPAGRLYWSIGDRGMSVTDREGKQWHHPREGVIVRSEPDGSNFEVFARGLRNTHEFAFDKHGNLITVDNDGDHAGESERLVYLVNGSDSGWRLNWQFGKYGDPKNNDYNVLMSEEYYKPRFRQQAAHLLPPLAQYHNGPAGMAYNPGTALNNRWNDHFFVASFVGSPTQSRIHAFTLKPTGASFELDRDVQVMEGLAATGLDFGPDGALYFADWIEGWELNQQGRIWKIDSPSDAESAVRVDTKIILAEELSGRSSEELLELLAHDDMRVRQKSQFELAVRDDAESLEQAIIQTDHQLKRIHGIWGLAQIGRRTPEAVEPLIPYLDDADTEIRAQAAKMLGDVRYEPAADSLITLLGDEEARVRFFATEALGRLAWRPALGAIVDMLEANDDEDVYLRHGGAVALERIGDAEAVTELADHPSRAVRIAAVVALRRLEHAGVARFLDDPDEFIVTNAARAINDDTFIKEGLDALAAMLEQDRIVNEPLLRRAINANLYKGEFPDAQRLAEFAVRNDIPDSLRIEALNTLSVWPASSQLDRVTGDPRGRVENDPEEARRAIAPVINDILEEEKSSVRIAGVRTVSNLAFTPAIPGLLTMVAEDSSPDVRAASLQALVNLEYHEIDQAVLTALEDEQQNVRMQAVRTIPDLSLPDESIVALIEPVLESGTVDERQEALRTLGGIKHPHAYELLEEQLRQLIQGELAPEVELEVVQVAEITPSASIKERLQAYRLAKPRRDSVSVYRESLRGGDAEEGRRIFYDHAAAQCSRCHAIGEEGSEVGPELTTVGDRLSREELLEAMVDPNARIAPGYGYVTLTLQNGETVRGVLSAETDSQIRVTRDGKDTVVDKSGIDERSNSPSGMPPMSGMLSRSELRDLVEFLTTLRASGG